MRWAQLFGDLEAQLDAAARADTAAEAADLQRLEVSRQRLTDRLRGAVGVILRLQVAGRPVDGRVSQVGPDWVLLDTTAGETLASIAAVDWAEGLGTTAEPPAGDVDARLGLGHLLRRLARDRTAVTILLRDGTALTGTIDRVGADVLDVAEHPADAVRRAPAVTRVRTVPFAALALVRPA